MKAQFEQMTLFYLNSLRENRDNDPVRTLISTFVELLDELISDEQKEFLDDKYKVEIRESIYNLLDAIDSESEDSIVYKRAIKKLVNDYL